MLTTTDYALIAGASYFDTRAPINRFPSPIGWILVSRIPEQRSGFEASAFGNGSDLVHSSEIVISYAGTYDKSGADIAADVDLFGGRYHAQLLQAARYYLDIKAANPGATISLGDGPAAHAGDTLTDGLPGTSNSIAARGHRTGVASLFGIKLGAFESRKRCWRWRWGRADAQVRRRPSLRPFTHAMRDARRSGARATCRQMEMLR